MNKIKTNSIIIVLFFFLGLNFAYSDPGSCSALCDQCEAGNGDLCDILYGGDAQTCYTVAPECGGIPINENAYLLVVLGGILIFTFGYIAKNKRLRLPSM